MLLVAETSRKAEHGDHYVLDTYNLRLEESRTKAENKKIDTAKPQVSLLGGST
jgi:hypothetical protein